MDMAAVVCAWAEVGGACRGQKGCAWSGKMSDLCMECLAMDGSGDRVFVRRQGAVVGGVLRARARRDATVEAAAAVCAGARDTGSRAGSLSFGAVCS